MKWDCILVAISCAVIFVGPTSRAGEVQCSISIASGSALSGVPCVVRIGVRNGTQKRQQVWSQNGPIQYGMGFTWRSKNSSIPVGVEDFGLELQDLGQPRAPTPIELAPGGRAEWFCAVPTPAKFGAKTKWKLEMRTLIWSNQPRTCSTPVVTRDGDQPAVPIAPNRLLQSTLLGIAQSNGFEKLKQGNHWGKIIAAARRGDCRARIVLFANELQAGGTSIDAWTGLKKCPAEIRCLRNYLYVARARKTGDKQLVSANDRRLIAESIKDADWFSTQIRALAD